MNVLQKGLLTLHDARRNMPLSGVRARRRERKERKADRRESRREIMAETLGIRRERQHGSAEKLRLVICFFDGRQEVF
jgi:hypothetical protein